MKRVLYVHGGLMNMGGTEAVMMNFFRNIDSSQVKIDFVVHGNGTSYYDEEIIGSGSKIYYVTPKGVNYKKNKKQLEEIIKNGNYSVVHSHMDAGNTQVLKIAKRMGVPCRISHCHNTAVQTKNTLKKVYNFLQKRQLPKYATHLFACSELAGKWLYDKKSFTVVNNAIDIDHYRFSAHKREQLRNSLNIKNDAPIIGHIGRFSYQKNHQKLIDIFKEFSKRSPDAMLIMIGDGETKSDILKYVKELGINDSVAFISTTPMSFEYMNAMDCFVLPSRFEGLPLVAIEAQAAGLPVVLADTISQTSKLTDLVDFVPLEATAEEWCNIIEKHIGMPRKDYSKQLKEKGFDIIDNTKKMQHFYLTNELLF